MPQETYASPVKTEQRDWKNPYSRIQQRHNPLKERYTEFCVNLNIYQADETDLNMSPEGKRRRRLLQDFEATNKAIPGYDEKMVDNYARKVQEEKIWNQQKVNNRIKIYE
jgi:hypothetical protein